MLHCQDTDTGKAQDIQQCLRKDTDQGKQKSAEMILADQKSGGKSDKKASGADKKENKGHSEPKKAGQPDQEGTLKMLPDGFQKNGIPIDAFLLYPRKEVLQIAGQGCSLNVFDCPRGKGAGDNAGHQGKKNDQVQGKVIPDMLDDIGLQASDHVSGPPE